MPWLKYRHKEAAGKGSWEWLDLGAMKNPADSIEHARFVEAANERAKDLAAEYEWSDKYRGIDFELVDDCAVPAGVVLVAIKHNSARFRQAEETARRLDEQLPIVLPCPICKDAPSRPPGLADKSNVRYMACGMCGRANAIEDISATAVRATK